MKGKSGVALGVLWLRTKNNGGPWRILFVFPPRFASQRLGPRPWAEQLEASSSGSEESDPIGSMSWTRGGGCKGGGG